MRCRTHILVILTLLTTLLAVVANVRAAERNVQVRTTVDLQADARLAAKRGVPVLLEFSASTCSYCELLESEILRPILLNGGYTNKVLIRKVVIDDASKLRDFDGRMVSMDDFVQRHNIMVTPTMLFFDPRGHELVPRMVGINTIDFFAGEVDQAIDTALTKLHAHHAALPAEQVASAAKP